ncbi:hypothetical protein RRG08_066323 [Elysia crispata]|uniref:Peptidase M13 N-terminal domain-containing protein n=1 Tax=Elysia crispata TaxID=231223 RepID=A0AAE1DIH1_9GAST|nr:hypothetical protein RRG08_066323 [Elysia crispata]
MAVELYTLMKSSRISNAYTNWTIAMVLAGLLFLISLVGHTEASCQTNIEATSPRHKRSTSDCAECCEDVCLTVDCIKEAAQISRSLDKTADPCDNFVNYACGIYFKTNRIRKDRVVVNPFQTMKYDNNKLMKDAILTEIKPTDRPFQRWPKMYFKSCMNTAQIEKIGLQPYLDTTFAKEWPTLLGSAWQNSTNFDIADLNAKYSAVMSNPLILMGSYRNLKNNSNYDIFVGGTGPLGISAGHLTTPRNGTILMAHEKLLRDMAIELGAEPSVAAKDAATYVDMAVALVKIIHRTRKFEETVNEFTMETLPENMTFMDIPRAIRSTFGTMNIRIPRNQKVVIWDYKLSYFNSLEKVLRSYTERDIRNLFGFIYARQRVLVTQKMLDILFELNKVLYDQRLRNSRFDECYRETLYYFQIILSNEFIRHLYSVHERQETKQKVGKN